MLLVGLGLVLAARAESFAGVLVSYGLLVGLGVGLAYVPAIAAVQRHFDRRRGLASGIAAAGIGLGTALVPLIAEWSRALGADWRLTFLLCGLGVAAIGVAGAAMLGGAGRGAAPIAPPRRLLPRGLRRPRAVVAATLRQRGFATCWLGALLIGLPVGLPFAYLCSFAAAEQGPRWEEAVQLLGLLGLASILGRFAFGALADEVGRRRTFLACCLGLVGATAWWAAARDTASLEGYAVAFGVAYGGFVALLPAFIVESFGTARVGAEIGLIYTSRAVALLAGPPLVALASDSPLGAALPIGGVALLGMLGTLLLARASRMAVARPM